MRRGKSTTFSILGGPFYSDDIAELGTNQKIARCERSVDIILLCCHSHCTFSLLNLARLPSLRSWRSSVCLASDGTQNSRRNASVIGGPSTSERSFCRPLMPP